jgi:hypothetical protein
VAAQPGDGQRDEHGENPLAIGGELSELAVLCCFNAEYLRRRARDWRRVDVVLSIIAAVLAGVAVTTGLAELVGRATVSYLALASAVTVAVKGSLGAAALADTREKASLEFQAIRREADHWRKLDLKEKTWQASRNELKLLTQRCNEAFKLTTAVSFTLQAARARRGAVPRKVLTQCLESSGCGQAPTE